MGDSVAEAGCPSIYDCYAIKALLLFSGQIISMIKNVLGFSQVYFRDILHCIFKTAQKEHLAHSGIHTENLFCIATVEL